MSLEAGWDSTGLFDGDGNLDRPISAIGLITVQGARVDGEFLVWSGDNPTEREADGEVLTRFLRLASPSADVAAFVERYGVLGLCEHDLPYTHNPPPLGRYAGPIYWCRPTEAESIAVWRQLAGQARAILNVADAVRRGRAGSTEDWHLIYARSGRDAPWWRVDAVIDRIKLVQVVNEWLALGNVRPILWGSQLKMTASGGLFGTIALRLAAAIAGAQSVYLCDGCGNPIDLSKRERRPQTGRRAYCTECRQNGQANRDRVARNRARRTGD